MRRADPKPDLERLIETNQKKKAIGKKDKGKGRKLPIRKEKDSGLISSSELVLLRVESS